MSPLLARFKLLAPLALICVATYYAYGYMLGPFWSATINATTEVILANGPTSTDEAAVPVSAILDIIAATVNASIDRFDPVQAHEQMNYNVDLTYPAQYEARLREIHHEFFGTDNASVSMSLAHLSRLPRQTEPIAKNIFFTGVEERADIPEECRSWTRLNPGWNGVYISDAQIEEWLERLLPPSVDAQAGVMREMKALRGKRGIIRSDLFRYLALYLEGGVYSDTDTACFRPISEWALNPDVRYAHPIEASLPDLLARAQSADTLNAGSQSQSPAEPSLVVAIEMDAWGTDWDWRGYKFARGIQVVQWTIMGKKGHPVFLDVLGRTLRQAKAIREAEERGETVDEPGVLDWSGPGAFTDALMRFLLVQHGVHPTDLAGMSSPRRYGDVVVLPMHAFRAEAADRYKDDGRVVFHGFYGRWKKEGDWA